MDSVFKKDLFRYYGEKGETIYTRLNRPLEIKYIFYLRKLQSKPSFFKKAYYMFRLKCISQKSHIQIPPSTKIGEGLYIGHNGRIIINPSAKLGKNINIATGVTIGRENRGRRKGVPTIGDNCWIGTNAVIVGDVSIGNDVLVAPLTFINFDVPDHSIVVGNPARIIYKENATEGYVNRTV